MRSGLGNRFGGRDEGMRNRHHDIAGLNPAAISANRRASVPLLTPTACRTSQNSAKSFSKSSTIGPPMNPAVLSALAKDRCQFLFEFHMRSDQIEKRNSYSGLYILSLHGLIR